MTAERQDPGDGVLPKVTTDSDPGPELVTRQLANSRSLHLRVARGEFIDRYVVLEQIGVGGMGVVFKALDPELERRVAIKLLKTRPGPMNTEGRARLVREGQAIARLAHPNVVAVHDVGVFRKDLFFVAMEYVEGGSLKQWLKAGRRSHREIIDVFVQAGQGLAAAHAKGLIHRDFKPDNVLVGDDGRVRVVDFGLARSLQSSMAEERPDSISSEENRSDSITGVDVSLTRTGELRGTPAFMAPEQFRGEVGDTRTDQFAFCVTLYQALCGQLPFASVSHPTEAKEQQAPASALPSEAQVPAWLERLVLRGLCLDPDDRFDSMETILAELKRKRGAQRRPALIAISVLAMVLVAALATTLIIARSDRKCQGGDTLVQSIWNDAIRQQVEQAFLATERPYAAVAFARTSERLDEYGADWITMYTAACAATQVHGVQSETLLDLRMLCLDNRLAELRALIMVFANADAKVVEKAVRAANELTQVSSCADVRALTERAPLPDDAAAREHVATARQLLADANAMRLAGKYEEGLALSARALAAAGASGYRPIEGEARLVNGDLILRSGDASAARSVLEQGVLDAIAGRDNKVAAIAATRLTFAVGYRLADHEQGAWWARAAKALLENGAGDLAIEGEVEINLAMVRVLQGRYDEAEAHARRSLDLREQSLGDDHPTTAAAHHTIGVILKKKGAYEDALVATQRSRAILVRALGEDHPDVAMALHNIGVAYKRLEDFGLARANLSRALEIWERTLPADHPNIGMALLNLGIVETSSGNLDDAEVTLERAREIKQARLGPDHWSVGKTNLALGNVLNAREQYPAALESQRLALAQLEGSFGKQHPDVAEALVDAADTLMKLGKFSEARAYLGRARTIREANPDDRAGIARVLVKAGHVELASGRVREAIDSLEKAVVIYGEDERYLAQLGGARFLLARALWKQGRDRQRAVALGESALVELGRGKRPPAKLMGELRQWIVERRPPE